MQKDGSSGGRNMMTYVTKIEPAIKSSQSCLIAIFNGLIYVTENKMAPVLNGSKSGLLPVGKWSNFHKSQ